MAVNVVAPSAGESVTEIEISRWDVSDGDVVNKDQVIAFAETEKATLEIRSPVNGSIKILSPAGAVVSPGTSVASIEEGAPNPTSKPKVAPDSSTEPSSQSPIPVQSEMKVDKVKQQEQPISEISTSSGEKVIPGYYATPSVRKMIVENNVNISQLLKSLGDENSPITEKDVESFLQQKELPELSQGLERRGSNSGEKRRETISRKMTRLRQTIANRLVSAQHSAALLTTFNEIDMGEVMAIRSQYKELFKKKHDIGLGFMSFFVKAACQALMEFPIINSMLEDSVIIEHSYADIGIAVATSKGLVVPVIKNAESLNFKEIEQIIADYGRKGKEGNISMDDLVGGTFTITNGGTFGSMLSTPIINPPQSAILGMHNIVERPVVRNSEIVIRPIMYVALSYDHRLIDGADSVRFLYRIKEFIEDPRRLLVGV